MPTIIESTVLITATCPSCGVLHAFPQRLKDVDDRGVGGRRRFFFCPNGHEWYYPAETVEVKLARERARADQLAAKARDLETDLAVERNKRHKLRARIRNGVCPCCHRSFQNVRRHIACRHPGYAQ